MARSGQPIHLCDRNVIHTGSEHALSPKRATESQSGSFNESFRSLPPAGGNCHYLEKHLHNKATRTQAKTQTMKTVSPEARLRGSLCVGWHAQAARWQIGRQFLEARPNGFGGESSRGHFRMQVPEVDVGPVGPNHMRAPV